MSQLNTCGGCETTWTAGAAAHCTSCHGTFADVELFDRHRWRGGCLDPSSVVDARGQRVMFRSDGMWRSVVAELAQNRGVR